MDPLQHLPTEARNPASSRLDELTSVELVELMNREDATLAAAVATQAGAIAQAIDTIAARLGTGGRLIYCGAGTSGRLGVLDASECPPTFQTDHNQIVGLIAGGQGAMFRAVEGAEDNPSLGASDLSALNVGPTDVVCGIASSGRTPYVLGALEYAKTCGAFRIAISCNPASEVESRAEIVIAVVVGPEVLSGSTRLKAGTATKMVLNMLTTGAMVRLGKAYGNLMVDLKASNIKLVARANRIVRTITGLDEPTAKELLSQCDGEVKTAIVAHAISAPAADARIALSAAGGRIAVALSRAGADRRRDEQSTALPDRFDIVLGIDGGGTHTHAIVALASTGEVLGQGSGGPSNIQSVGVELALKSLDDSIDRAFASANVPRSRVGAAGLGLAGIDREEGLNVINGWATRVGLAQQRVVANDATLLLAAGTPEGWGLAVIAGTGSIAFVRTSAGAVGRCGGWGHTLGDEGSAYMIALTALRAACRAHDRCGEPTILVEQFVKQMNLQAAPDLIPAVYRGPWDRAAIAGLAPLVLHAAESGDAVARSVVHQQAEELARTAAAAVTNNDLPTRGLPIALAGGVFLGSELYRSTFLTAMQHLQIEPGTVQVVSEPALGAVVLARRLVGARVG